MNKFATITSAIILSVTSLNSQAGVFGDTTKLSGPEVQVNQITPNLDLFKFEQACYGCISPSTGRPRTEYVQPHFRSNGTYVNGYWRS
ncbi:hypothetical protein OAM79_00615 [Litorivicinus sp.]|nr:hypothetical protein [Litorivicinus sp.]